MTITFSLSSEWKTNGPERVHMQMRKLNLLLKLHLSDLNVLFFAELLNISNNKQNNIRRKEKERRLKLYSQNCWKNNQNIIEFDCEAR